MRPLRFDLLQLARSFSDRFGIWAVLLLGAVLRFWDLGYPHKLVFDETYYVKDAYTLSKLGYESAWPSDPNPAFEAGQVDTFLTNPSYVVHPPLGKWIISIGMSLFGAQHSFSWRISVAVLGVASIWLLYLVTNKVLGSRRWAMVAALLLAIDGHAIVLSRTGLLDGILAFFALLGFFFLLKDRETSMLQYLKRPWLLAMAIALGAATAVKWSGLYFLMVFAIYVVISDLLRAKKLHAKNLSRRYVLSGVGTFLLTVPFAVLTYVASWSGWLFTSGGYYRNFDENPLVALWHYHQQAYGFHVGLHSSHPYAANPLGWLILLRPTSFFYEGSADGQNGCEFFSGCSSAITALGNPLIWLVAAVAVIMATIFWFRTRDRQVGLILLGIVAGYLPWLAFMNRTTFAFYGIVFLPFTIMALVWLLRHQAMRHLSEPSFNEIERQDAVATSLRRTIWYLLTCLAVSAFFLPIWIGTNIPYWFWLIHMWIPTWI